jgi:hypothetical protein
MAIDPLADRLTIVETVYHQHLHQPPTAIETRYQRSLKTSEQVYSHQCTATEDWQPLELGWLKSNVGMLVITNDEGHFTQVNPTEAERETAEKKILELSYGVTITNPSWLILPRESFRGQPAPAWLDSLFIRCRSGSCKYTVNVVPA